jgi:putative NADPH-quinone reductase
MNISIILGHPAKGSFNHAIAETVRDAMSGKGYKIFYHDLYAEKFDPVLPDGETLKSGAIAPNIQRYCNEIAGSNVIIIVHPNWWGQPPAILKGWVDRILRPGVAYKFQESDSGEGIPIGLLKAKAAIVFNTSNTPLEREQNVFGDPLEQLWKKCIFDLCGVNKFYRKVYSVVCTSTPEQRKAWLKDVREVVSITILEKLQDENSRES